jgi:hypothetical protein
MPGCVASRLLVGGHLGIGFLHSTTRKASSWGIGFKLVAVPTEALTFPSPNGPGRLLILRKLLYFSLIT